MKRQLANRFSLAAFVLFVMLAIFGKVNVWMAVFALGVILSLYFSRIYCGILCPIHAPIKLVTKLRKKLNLRDVKIPEKFYHGALRYGMLLLFAGLLFVLAKGKVGVPAIVFLVVLGPLISLFLPARFFHEVLCPFGTILHLSSAPARKALAFAPGVKACEQVAASCPVSAIDPSPCFIRKRDCVLCLNCVSKAAPGMITYRNTSA